MPGTIRSFDAPILITTRELAAVSGWSERGITHLSEKKLLKPYVCGHKGRGLSDKFTISQCLHVILAACRLDLGDGVSADRFIDGKRADHLEQDQNFLKWANEEHFPHHEEEMAARAAHGHGLDIPDGPHLRPLEERIEKFKELLRKKYRERLSGLANRIGGRGNKTARK
jgi:hypothetical protein